MVPAADVEAALACIARFEGHLGAARVALILHGQVDSWARSKAWVQDLAFFGSLRAWEVDRIRDLIGNLLDLGYVARGHGEKPTLRLTPIGLQALAGERPMALELQTPPAPPPAARRRGSKVDASKVEMDEGATLRFEELRSWRLEVARRDEVLLLRHLPRQDPGRNGPAPTGLKRRVVLNTRRRAIQAHPLRRGPPGALGEVGDQLRQPLRLILRDESPGALNR